MMRKRLISLLLITVVVLLAGLLLTQRQQADSGQGGADGPLIAGLAEQLNAVTGLKVTAAEGKLVADLAKRDGGWVVANHHDYPADMGKVREYLIKLSESKVREVKTSKPENYARLGVEDLGSAVAKGLGVELAGLKAPAKLIVGISAGTGSPGTFVRRDGEAQSLLVSGDLIPEKEGSNWMAKEIIDLPSSEVLAVAVTAPDKSVLKIDKQDPNAFNYTVYNLPKGRQLSSDSAGNLIAGSLAGLTLEDVSPAADAPVDDKTAWTATYVSYSGLVVDATLWGEGEKSWLRVAARVDEATLDAWVSREQSKAEAERASAEAAAKAVEAAKAAEAPKADGASADAAKAAEPPALPAPFDAAKAKADKRAELDKRVAEINAKAGPWTYAIPSWKAANIKKKIEDLLQPKG
ncbi:MAG: DUF4340 domain-containing protein [Lysobacterales bacterium]